MSESPEQDSSLMKQGHEEEDQARMTSKPSTVTSPSKEETNGNKNQDDEVHPENDDTTDRQVNFVQTDITAQTTRSNEEKDSFVDNQYVQQRAMRNVMSWRPPTPPRSSSSSSSPRQETTKQGSEKKWKTLDVGVPSLFQRVKQKPTSPIIVPMLTGDDHSLYLNSNQEQDEQKTQVKTHRKRKQNANRITNVIQSMISGSSGSHDSIEQKEDDTYQMMKSQHGKGQQHKRKLPSDQASFFYSGIEQLERERQERNDAFGQLSTIPPQNHPTSSTYFNHTTRREFIQQHTLLNANYSISLQEDNEDKDEWHDDDFDLTTLFQFGSSPQSRDRHEKRQREMQRAPIVADIRKSSLSYMRQGRIQMRVPTDNVRLVMDEFLDGGILSVECDDQYQPLKVESNSQEEKPLTTVAIGLEMTASENSMNDPDLSFDNDANIEDRKRSPLELHDDECMEQGLLSSPIRNDIDRNRLDIERVITTRPPDLRYILTVDQDLYKRVLSEISHSRAPCGLYNCCHEAGDGSHQHVHISVALIILFLVFTLLLWGTIEFPTN